MSTTLLRTPLYDRHVALGARMVPFAGWEMPVQYAGVIPEHKAVRADAGVFDVSHMGEFEVEGPRATELLQATLSNDLQKIQPGEAQYTLLTNDRGGIIDDLIAYRLDEFRYLLIVNAANREVDFAWLKEREIPGSDVRTIMRDAGSALMGIGRASGENRAAEAARIAVSSPLLEASIEGATGILLNVTGGPDMGLFEVNEAAEVVTGAADQNANVIFGAVIDDSIGDEVQVTVIATGFGGQGRRRRRPRETELDAPLPAATSASESFDSSQELDVPSFLRDD